VPVPLRIIVYPLFALLSFLIFFVVLFPFDSIKGRIEAEAEKGLGGKYQVRISDLSMAPISGINMEEVIIREKGGEQIRVFRLDGALLSVDLLPLLWGSMRVAFDLEVDGGSITGKISRSGDELEVHVDIEKLNLAAFPIIKQNYGVDLSSDIDGKIDMEIYPQSPLRNNGAILLNFNSLKMAESNIMNVFPLPPLVLAAPQGKSKIDFVMNKGNIEIRELDLRGGDLDLDLGGKVYLAQRISNFRFNLRGKLGFSEKLANELPMLAIVEKQKTPDGLYPINITGRLKKPNIKVGEFKIPL